MFQLLRYAQVTKLKVKSSSDGLTCIVVGAGMFVNSRWWWSSATNSSVVCFILRLHFAQFRDLNKITISNLRASPSHRGPEPIYKLECTEIITFRVSWGSPHHELETSRSSLEHNDSSPASPTINFRYWPCDSFERR